MHDYQIISNIKEYANKLIEINFPISADIRKTLTNELQKIEQNPNEIILIQLKAVGKRILNNLSAEDAIKLIDGRKHKTYYAIKKHNKIHIKFFASKIKRLNNKEKDFLIKNWHLGIFEKKAKFLVKHINGCFYPENLIYKYIDLKF